MLQDSSSECECWLTRDAAGAYRPARHGEPLSLLQARAPLGTGQRADERATELLPREAVQEEVDPVVGIEEHECDLLDGLPAGTILIFRLRTRGDSLEVT